MAIVISVAIGIVIGVIGLLVIAYCMCEEEYGSFEKWIRICDAIDTARDEGGEIQVWVDKRLVDVVYFDEDE